MMLQKRGYGAQEHVELREDFKYDTSLQMSK